MEEPFGRWFELADSIDKSGNGCKVLNIIRSKPRVRRGYWCVAHKEPCVCRIRTRSPANYMLQTRTRTSSTLVSDCDVTIHKVFVLFNAVDEFLNTGLYENVSWTRISLLWRMIMIFMTFINIGVLCIYKSNAKNFNIFFPSS